MYALPKSTHSNQKSCRECSKQLTTGFLPIQLVLGRHEVILAENVLCLEKKTITSKSTIEIPLTAMFELV